MREWSTNQPFGFITNHFAARRNVVATVSNYDFETTPSASFVREQEWENSNSYRLGFNKKASEAWDVRFGAVYDENPQPTQHVSPLLPDSDRIGATIGTGWHGGPLRVDWSLMVLHFKDRDTNGINSEGFNGKYQTDAVLWSINAGYRF